MRRRARSAQRTGGRKSGCRGQEQRLTEQENTVDVDRGRDSVDVEMVSVRAKRRGFSTLKEAAQGQ